MVDFKLEDLDIGSSFNLDDLDLSKPKSQYSRLADLDLDPKVEDVMRDKQQDVLRLYDVFEDNPEVVEVYKSKLNRGEVKYSKLASRGEVMVSRGEVK